MTLVKTYDEGIHDGWAAAAAKILELDLNAGDDKAFRCMVLAEFIPDVDKRKDEATE